MFVVMLFPFFHTFVCFFPLSSTVSLSLSLVSTQLYSTLLSCECDCLCLCVCACYGVCLVLLFRCLFQSPKRSVSLASSFINYSTFTSVPLFFLPFPLDFFFRYLPGTTTYKYIPSLPYVRVFLGLFVWWALFCCCCLLL